MRRWIGAAVIGLGPGPAAAHSPIEGIEGFYVGFLHPVSTPSQLLALLALGLLLVHGWPDRAGRWLGAFVGALAVGMAAGQAGLDPAPLPPVLLGVAVAVAALAALAPAAPGWTRLVAAAATGLLVGVVSTPDPGPMRATLITLAGSFVGANLATVYATGAAGWLRERFPRPWVHIGQRVLSAWVAAIAALMLAFAFASGLPAA